MKRYYRQLLALRDRKWSRLQVHASRKIPLSCSSGIWYDVDQTIGNQVGKWLRRWNRHRLHLQHLLERQGKGSLTIRLRLGRQLENPKMRLIEGQGETQDACVSRAIRRGCISRKSSRGTFIIIITRTPRTSAAADELVGKNHQVM